MILTNISNLIKITEDNFFVQAKHYGISGIIDNWLTKIFSSNITDNFDSLIGSIDSAAKQLQIELIDQKENEEILNKAIHHCKDEEDGKCIIGIFFDAINHILTIVIDKYVDLLFQNKIQNIDKISSLQDLSKVNLKEFSMSDIYNNYINAIKQDNYNKLFFKMRGSTIDSSFIKDKLNFIDNYITTIINNKMGKRVSVSSR